MGFCLREGAFSSEFSKCISRCVGRAGVLTNFGKALNSIGFFDTNGLGAFSVRSQKITNAMTKMHPNAGPGRQEKTYETNFKTYEFLIQGLIIFDQHWSQNASEGLSGPRSARKGSKNHLGRPPGAQK